jgi:hypothetical protein
MDREANIFTTAPVPDTDPEYLMYRVVGGARKFNGPVRRAVGREPLSGFRSFSFVGGEVVLQWPKIAGAYFGVRSFVGYTLMT